ncbi:hypothetical protein BHM03_00009309 [Ensete ventricosum]|nr:hypothetical protein BHM03_00009309 [Ensete ventricosum]
MQWADPTHPTPYKIGGHINVWEETTLARAAKSAANSASEVEAFEHYTTRLLLHASLILHGASHPRPITLHRQDRRTTWSCPRDDRGKVERTGELLSHRTINSGAEKNKRKDKPTDNWELTTKRWAQPRSGIQIPTDIGELAYSVENRLGRHLSSTPEGSTIFLALEGGPISQDHPTSRPKKSTSTMEHHTTPRSKLRPRTRTPRKFEVTLPELLNMLREAESAIKKEKSVLYIGDKSMIRKRYLHLNEEILKDNPNVCAYMAPSLDARQDIVVVEIPKLGKKAAV